MVATILKVTLLNQSGLFLFVYCNEMGDSISHLVLLTNVLITCFTLKWKNARCPLSKQAQFDYRLV